MSVKMFFEAIIKFLLGVVLIGLLIFLPAGTLNYLNGWIFMGILFIPMLIAGIVMMIKNGSKFFCGVKKQLIQNVGKSAPRFFVDLGIPLIL